MDRNKKAWKLYLNDLRLHKEGLENDLQYHVKDEQIAKKRIKNTKEEILNVNKRIKEAETRLTEKP